MRIEHIHSLSPALQDLLERAVGKGPSDAAALAAIDKKLDKLLQQGDAEQMDFKRLTASVAQNTDAANSAKETLAALAAEIRANAGNQAALEALADSIDANNTTIADAIVANTPAAPPVATV